MRLDIDLALGPPNDGWPWKLSPELLARQVRLAADIATLNQEAEWLSYELSDTSHKSRRLAAQVQAWRKDLACRACVILQSIGDFVTLARKEQLDEIFTTSRNVYRSMRDYCHAGIEGHHRLNRLCRFDGLQKLSARLATLWKLWNSEMAEIGS
jgi:hypothetical protein